MPKKNSSAVIATSSFKINRNVTVQYVEEKAFTYSIDGNTGEYYRLLVSLGDNDSKTSFGGGQINLVLNAKTDYAYPLMKEQKPGTQGVAVFEVRVQIVESGINKDTGEQGCPAQEVELHLLEFSPEKETVR